MMLRFFSHAAAAAAAAAALFQPTSELALVPPMLGMSQQLLHRDHAATYYGDMPACSSSGRPLRRHGDEVERLAGGYYRALGRTDDTMNLAGIKVRDTLLGGGGYLEERNSTDWPHIQLGEHSCWAYCWSLVCWAVSH
jgi:hypothetical protein